MVNRRLFFGSILACASGLAAAQFVPLPTRPREKEAVDFAVAWLDLVEAGDEARSYELLTPTFQHNLTRADWHAAVAATKATQGKLQQRSLRRVVWYDNPENAPLPGVYAAVEFDSVFEKSNKHFRYVVLHSQDGAPFRVMRSESTSSNDGSKESN